MSYLGMPPPDDERLFDLNYINYNWENENETNNIGIPIENKEDLNFRHAKNFAQRRRNII